MRMALLILLIAVGATGAGCSSAPVTTDVLACPPIYNGCFAD